MLRTDRSPWPTLLALVGGCGGDVSVGVLGDGTTSAGTGGGSATGNADTGQSTATEDRGTGDEEIKFDIGDPADVPEGLCSLLQPDNPNCHCTAVDILFVVDNSGSMQVHAPAVKSAFDTFVSEMVSVLPFATSLHVGVTRATGFFDPGNSSTWNGPACTGTVDGDWNPPTLSHNGINGHQGRLYEHDGKRFFELVTGNDPLPLETWFEGALAGAIDPAVLHSNSETVVAGAAYPFHPVNATENAGFMREPAVLVLFLLSDAPDFTPEHIATSDFIEMVRDAKPTCGDACIITTGAIQGACYDQAGNVNTRLFDFMNGFGEPPASWVSYPPNFEGVLGAALAEAINTTCEKIPPAG
jgi:hypothetical protein